jgi:Protein of unknown function (DUF2442)
MGIVSTRRKDQEFKVVFNDDSLIITDADFKETAIPLLWYQALKNATEKQKNEWVLSDDGTKLIWKSLNIEILI